MKELNYAAAMIIIAGILCLSGCSGEVAGQACSGDWDCPEEYYCALSGGVFFSSDICALKVGAKDGDASVYADVDEEIGKDVIQPGDIENNMDDAREYTDSDIDTRKDPDVPDGGKSDGPESTNDARDVPDPLILAFHVTPDPKSLEKEVRFEYGCENDAVKKCSYVCSLESTHLSDETADCQSEIKVDMSKNPFGKYTLRVTATDIDQQEAEISYSWSFDFGWKDVSAGGGYTCGIISNGALYCWGKEVEGRMGYNVSLGDIMKTPQRVGTGNDWEAVEANETHSCGLRTDDSLWCWGSNSSHQLGVDPVILQSSEPVRVGNAPGEGMVWKSFAIGQRHSCAIQKNNTLWCWGANDQLQLGVDAGIRTFVPQLVSADSDWVAVYAAGDYTCGKKSNETVQCWGDNVVGQLGLGNGALNPTRTPVSIPGAAKWKSFSAGYEHSCGIQKEGSLWCWGADKSGRLGLGPESGTAKYSTPMQVQRATNWSVVVIKQYHSCAMATTGALWCWGNGNEGQLGHGKSGESRDEPTRVLMAMTDWLDVSLGKLHTCGISSPGKLYCWGNGSNGELGIGNLSQYSVPVEVSWRP